MFKLFILAVIVTAQTSAQYTVINGYQRQSFQMAGGNSFPSSCKLRDVWLKTGGSNGFYACTVAGTPGTWTIQSSAGSITNLNQITTRLYSDLQSLPTLPTELTLITSQFISSYNASTGAFGTSTVAFADLVGTALDAQIPANIARLASPTFTGIVVLPTGQALTSPTLSSPALGTPTALVATNVTGTAAGLTSGITNALKSLTTTVDVSSSSAPIPGYVLKATGISSATWQNETGDVSQSGNNIFTGYNNFVGGTLRFPESTVAGLPSAASNTGRVFRVTNSVALNTCGTGGGSQGPICISDGTNWLPIAPSVSGGTAITVGTAGATTTVGINPNEMGYVLYCTNSTSSPTVFGCNTPSSLVSTYITGLIISWNVGATACTGGVSTTLNINGVGAKRVYQYDGTSNPTSVDCAASRTLLAQYDSTLTAGAGGWKIIGGSPSAIPLSTSSSDPAGACVGPLLHRNSSTGNLWYCGDITWQIILTAGTTAPGYMTLKTGTFPGAGANTDEVNIGFNSANSDKLTYQKNSDTVKVIATEAYVASNSIQKVSWDQTMYNSWSPADSTTYYWGGSDNINTTNNNFSRFPCPLTGFIDSIAVLVYDGNSNAGTEATVLTVMQGAVASSAAISFPMLDGAGVSSPITATGLSAAVTFGESLTLRMVTPAWATNPQVRLKITILFRSN